MNMQRTQSERLIGYVGHDIPIELILAANAVPTAIQGRAGHATPHADRYLEPTFLPAIRSIAEQWLTGELDEIEAVVFTRSDDSAQRLYYYLCELQRRGLCRGPTPLIYDIASCDRASSETHTIAATRALAQALDASEDALNDAMQRVRERMALSLAATRTTLVAPPARGSFVQQTMRAAERDWSIDFDHTLRAQDPSPVASDATRLMLIGSVPAAEDLHEIAEQSGANIVATLNTQTPYGYDSTSNKSDPYRTIARRCRAHPWRSIMQSPNMIRERLKEASIDGVILWTVAEDTGLAWVCPPLERALRAGGTEVLTLTMQPWAVPPSTLDAVQSFIRTLRARA
jgi:benzoyl-CoA reductase/2-hydroxyglutaryl-CoA dehydratase subunit BcrC/BadD/HgdB